ncbi:MAG: phosphoribosylglycinamide synthetase C domain-containing protein, partial [Steroidobacteraceae bacterium]
VLCAVGLGDRVSDAQREAYALVDCIHYEGMQLRRDIGYQAIARELADDATRQGDASHHGGHG